jgi:hypothetical protein
LCAGRQVAAADARSVRRQREHPVNRYPVLEEYWRIQRERRAPAQAARRADPRAYYRRLRATLESAYETIAADLKPQGFRLNRHRGWLSRRSDGIIHRIAFTTSGENIPEVFTALYVHFWVIFPPIAEWRQAADRAHWEYLSSRHLDSWEPDKASIEHDIGPLSQREAELADIVARIRRDGLPYFEGFRDRSAILRAADAWPRGGFASYEIGPAIEYALFVDERQIAQALVNRFFERRPDLLSAYHDFTSGKRIHPSNSGPDVFAHDIAELVRAHGLEHPAAAV